MLLAAAAVLFPPAVPRAAAQDPCAPLDAIPSYQQDTLIFPLLRAIRQRESFPGALLDPGKRVPGDRITFALECHTFELPRKPRRAVLSSTPDGLGKLRVDDYLKLERRTPDGRWERFWELDFSRLASDPRSPPIEPQPIEPAVLTRYFGNEGTDSIQVTAQDFWTPYVASTDVYLVVELEPLPPLPIGQILFWLVGLPLSGYVTFWGLVQLVLGFLRRVWFQLVNPQRGQMVVTSSRECRRARDLRRFAMFIDVAVIAEKLDPDQYLPPGEDYLQITLNGIYLTRLAEGGRIRLDEGSHFSPTSAPRITIEVHSRRPG